jgi:hypothetical protein
MLLYCSFIFLFLAGAFGAFISDVVKDNSIEMPKKIDEVLCLGFLGGVIVGGFAGLLIDGSMTTAFMGGFVGKEMIIKLIKVSK